MRTHNLSCRYMWLPSARSGGMKRTCCQDLQFFLCLIYIGFFHVLLLPACIHHRPCVRVCVFSIHWCHLTFTALSRSLPPPARLIEVSLYRASTWWNAFSAMSWLPFSKHFFLFNPNFNDHTWYGTCSASKAANGITVQALALWNFANSIWLGFFSL